MSLNNRRFSLDSSVSPVGGGSVGTRRGSRFNKKSKPSQTLNEAQLEIQELSHSLDTTLRESTITEVNHVSDDLTTKNSQQKHNRTYHRLFEEIPKEEKLLHTFTCALQKEVLYHGKLFVSENHFCFHSSVLLKDTKVVVPVFNVRTVKTHSSALSMLSIHTNDGEKYSFVSLGNREKCYNVLLMVYSQAQGKSFRSSPHVSDHEPISSYSSQEDSVDLGSSRQNSIVSLPPLSNDVPGSDFLPESSTIEEDHSEAERAVSWIWRMTETIMAFFFLREVRNLSMLFYVYVILLVLLLLTSGYIGLRIIALEEQLNSLGGVSELSFQNKEFQET
ncbi:GRAM domain-containing protein 2A-like [Genypterus blacodes]|uniref:GRAM domain-containing protein 2A-like n=1 Tax=Genypterus blacodes TaxID=154954 RepID=UPI003F7748C7